MSSNIFEIWEKAGNNTPFAVRRDNWSNEYYTIVEKIECDKLPYGLAFGYPTKNGNYSNHYEYNQKWRKDRIIPCCGCYQWTLVEDADFESYKKGKTATKKTVFGAKTIISKFTFGKYRGEIIMEIFNTNPEYIEWAINKIDNFFLTPEAFDYLSNLNDKFTFNQNTIEVNDKKVSKRLK